MTDIVVTPEIVNVLFVYGFLAALAGVFVYSCYRVGMVVLYIVLVAAKDNEENEAAGGDSVSN
ncbi:hypothetical protein [Halococcus sediminicola]|uniref:hypothetical protein n=1 Tax=Halococcus sediminicola TaxID=1264579 RepID=UPI0012ABD410|nr:hypothetical protein [Halococcus sediminicola]